MATLQQEDLGRVVHVDYNYKYKANDGKLISINEGDEFILIKKSNPDWWQVIKLDQKKPFYIPATYVTVLSKRSFPENHAYFKKAHAAMQKSRRKKEVLPRHVGRERIIAVAGSREDLTVLSSSSKDDYKFSEMRASCDSLDRFIENENPYDEVPMDTTPSVQLYHSKLKDYEEPEYANLETIQKSVDDHRAKKKSNSDKVKKSSHSEFQTDSSKENRKSNSLPYEHSPIHSTTVEVLEDGWEVQLDNQTGSTYYYNPRSGAMKASNPLHEKSGRDVVPPAVPDVSKKPTLDRAKLSPFDENIASIQRRQSSPARYKSRKTSSLSSKSDPPRAEIDNPWKNANSNNSLQLSPGAEKKHKKSNSDARREGNAQTYSPITSNTSSRSSSFNAGPSSPLQGWFRERSADGEIVFVNESNGDRWCEMTDEQSGKYYYFNELTRQTSWELPQFNFPAETEEIEWQDNEKIAKKRNTLDRETIQRETDRLYDKKHSLSLPKNASLSAKPRQRGRAFQKQATRIMHARSMILLNDVQPNNFDSEPLYQQQDTNLTKSFSSEHNLSNDSGTMEDRDISGVPLPHPIIERSGKLNWTKLMEAGKKQRKNWVQQWVVLLANNLVFYRDHKQATMTKSLPHGKPESSCDLRGAQIDWAKDKSSKKNVLQLQTVRGMSLLLQHEDQATSQKWLHAIKNNILKANQVDPLDATELYKYEEEEENDSKKKKDKKKKTTRHGSDAKNSDRVRSKLKKFIQKRPTMESLQERGIIKETVFGCPLVKLCEKEKATVPNFVRLCVNEVDRRGLTIDGIYRVSGNLSHVQKLRYMIDRDEEVNLSDPEWEDIHLVTGALKMFLRELPEPVIPFNFFDKFIAACKMQDPKQRISAMTKLVEILPKANKDTLSFLMSHFHRVVQHSNKNRMQIQNVAIVFGPTLLLKPDDQNDQSGGHMAIYMVYQNQIIDFLLTEYATIFKK